jgi:regulator of replication initiation timing
MFFLALPVCAIAQTSAEVKEILDRLTRLEEENRSLANEVHALREQITASHNAPASEPATEPPDKAPDKERLDVLEQRVNEQAQTKVEASQKLPIKLTGTLLFNAAASSIPQPPRPPKARAGRGPVFARA